MEDIAQLEYACVLPGRIVPAPPLRPKGVPSPHNEGVRRWALDSVVTAHKSLFPTLCR
jgi:hypothetical protein